MKILTALLFSLIILTTITAPILLINIIIIKIMNENYYNIYYLIMYLITFYIIDCIIDTLINSFIDVSENLKLFKINKTIKLLLELTNSYIIINIVNKMFTNINLSIITKIIIIITNFVIIHYFLIINSKHISKK